MASAPATRSDRIRPPKRQSPQHIQREMEGPKRRRRDWTLTPKAFERLLSVLDPDRVRAGELYERIRVKLTFLFEARGCPSPSHLVDATFDRAAQKFLEIQREEIRDATSYICRIAHFILKENYRAPERREDALDDQLPCPAPFEDEDSAGRERIHDAFDRCLDRLAPDKRRLINEYYQGERRTKKEARVELARSLGITMDALGLRAFRIRRELEACVNERLHAS